VAVCRIAANGIRWIAVPPTSSNHPADYEPVVPTRIARGGGAEPGEFDARSLAEAARRGGDSDEAVINFDAAIDGAANAVFSPEAPTATPQAVRRGHALTYAGLFLFSFVLFYRPYEFLPLPSNLAFWLAAAALAVYVPSQLMAEGTLTARPREVNLVLLFCVAALLSVVFAKESVAEAWTTFSDMFVRAVLIFIVIVNASRTERRLRALMLLSIGSALVMSAGALNDFWSGRLTVEGYRVGGQVGGIFGNPNDMALHLVTMLPLAAALMLGSRGLLKKALYAVCALMMMAGTFVTFSRGGFLGLAAALFVLAWALWRKNRFAVVACACALTVAFFALAPGSYTARIFSIFDRSLDAYGSADARQALLLRSILVAVRHPLFGVGMGNFSLVSLNSQVSHNAYTQVAAEMGAAALVIYVLFIVTPLKGLLRIARETFDARRASRFYYLAVGMQASLAAYMVASFFGSVAYYWNIYYLVGYAVCLRRLYEAEPQQQETRAVAVEGEGAASGSAGAAAREGEAAREEDFVGSGVAGRVGV
jgi:O-antigen ligase